MNKSNENGSTNSNDPSKLMPKARSNGFMAPLSPSSYILIGGSDREKAFNDVWILLPDSKKWVPTPEKNIISSSFFPRAGFTGVVTNKTPDEITFYLHGGLDFFSQKFFADMYQITVPLQNNPNLSDNIESDILNKAIVINHTVYPLDITKIPCERNSHCMCFNSKDNVLYIFGGGTKEKMLNDLWQFNMTSNTYDKIIIDNIDNIIAPRELFGMVYDEKKNELIIFGGRLYEKIDKNSYIIDLTSKTCKVGHAMPAAICAFAFTKVIYGDKSYVIMYGGTDGNNLLNCFIIYDIEKGTFKKSKLIINKELVNNDPSLSVFLGRISSIITVDETNNNIILYGGSASDKEWSYINIIPIKDIMNGIL